MRLKISVEQRHIKSGCRVASCGCPIALAAMDAGLDCPIVGPWSISFDKDGSHTQDKLSVRASRFVRSFDDGKPVKPFKFFVNV